MSNLPILRDVAPHWDNYDWAFLGVISAIFIAGLAAFVDTPWWEGVNNPWTAFVQNSGLIVILTGCTAMIAIYRLRHRPDKNRPTVREDFNNLDGEGVAEFGLRNFGPGPALYVQAVATIEQEGEEIIIEEYLARHRVHESPIHLREGEFLDLLGKANDGQLTELANGEGPLHSKTQCGSTNEQTPVVNLYYTYVSQSGAREPTDLSSDGDAEDLLAEIQRSSTDPRSIHVKQVVDNCLTRY